MLYCVSLEPVHGPVRTCQTLRLAGGNKHSTWAWFPYHWPILRLKPTEALVPTTIGSYSFERERILNLYASESPMFYELGTRGLHK